MPVSIFNPIQPRGKGHRPRGLVERLGLKEGDIVKSANNSELNSVLHALSVY